MASGDGRAKPGDEGSTKPLLDKLGVKPGMRVSVLGLEDEGFLSELEERTWDVATGSPIGESDLLFVGFRARDDLVRLKDLEEWIKRDGAIWAVWRKGQQELKEGDIIAGPRRRPRRRQGRAVLGDPLRAEDRDPRGPPVA